MYFFLDSYFIGCNVLFCRGECRTCHEYVRRVQSLVPGVAAVVGLLCVLVFFESIFMCKKRGEEFRSRVREALGISYVLHFSVGA